MSRIVSIWLRAWPIARLMLGAQASRAPQADLARPLVLAAPGKGGARIVSLNRAARRGGLARGELVSSARAKVLDLQVREADPAADAAALRCLALWCLRYAPIAMPWDTASGADGLFLDITGCAHLFGGEERMLADMSARLRAFGLFPRLAVAGTAGAAWALARHGHRDCAGIACGDEAAALQGLPLAALRLDEDALLLMRRLGLRTIGQVMHRPRGPLAARFPADLMLRLDQALGLAPEPLVPVAAPPAYRAQTMFLEPILSQEHVLAAARHLLAILALDMARAGVGARLLRLMLFAVDGRTLSLDLGLAAPSREAEHIVQLIALRLHRLGSELETDFGFEAAAIDVLTAESLPERQDHLGLVEDATPPEALARLIDRLQQRLGRDAVRRLHPEPSHIPERAVRPLPAASPSPSLRSRGESWGEGQPKARPQPASAPHPDPLPMKNGERERAASSSSPRKRGAEQLMLRKGPPQAIREGLAPQWGETSPSAARPLLLLERPELAEVLAVVPDGPPRHFRWRGVLHQVADADGPERITPEWWRRTTERTRDYFVVEDTAGRRFWLFRAGLYGESTTPQWFVHGLFA